MLYTRSNKKQVLLSAVGVTREWVWVPASESSRTVGSFWLLTVKVKHVPLLTWVASVWVARSSACAGSVVEAVESKHGVSVWSMVWSSSSDCCETTESSSEWTEISLLLPKKVCYCIGLHISYSDRFESTGAPVVLLQGPTTSRLVAITFCTVSDEPHNEIIILVRTQFWDMSRRWWPGHVPIIWE